MNSMFSLSSAKDLLKQSVSFSAAAAIVLASLAPALILHGQAGAAQVTERSITISTSQRGTSATYSVSFNPFTSTGDGADDILGIVVDFCQAGSGGGPLVGTVCAKTNGVAGIQVSGNIAVSHTGATGSPVSFTANDPTGTDMDGSTLILTNATGLDVITPANPITFSFTATNPTGNFSTNNIPTTYYARIITYNTEAAAQAYDSTTTGANNPGTHLDNGGIALSTANQLTVNARVQEELEFCVGRVDNTVTSAGTFSTYNGGNTCGGTAFSSTSPSVDLGVVSSNAVSISPVAAASGGNGLTGALLIRTNAVNGATITYFAEQNSGSGRLKVAGQSCSATGAGSFDAGSNLTDQCFNSNLTQSDFTATANGQQEEFGMTGSAKYDIGGTTSGLVRDTNYDGDGTAASGFAWRQDGTAVALASSAASTPKVLDYEAVILSFAARSAATTPTGQYTVTSTYVATSTF